VLPRIDLSSNDTTASEPGTDTGLFFVNRSGASTTSSLTVQLVYSGTATSGVDYVAGPTQVTIPANASRATVTLTVINDAIAEPREDIVITARASLLYTVGSSAGISVFDDEPPVVLAGVLDANAAEVRADRAFLLLRRLGNLSPTLTVNVAFSGTATLGTDYAALTTSPGSQTQSGSSTDIVIVPFDDAVDEDTETVVMTVLPGSGYSLGTPTNATATIADNDPPTSITIGNTVVNEGNSFTFPVQASFIVKLNPVS
jgi:hypothetical protein